MKYRPLLLLLFFYIPLTSQPTKEQIIRTCACASSIIFDGIKSLPANKDLQKEARQGTWTIPPMDSLLITIGAGSVASVSDSQLLKTNSYQKACGKLRTFPYITTNKRAQFICSYIVTTAIFTTIHRSAQKARSLRFKELPT